MAISGWAHPPQDLLRYHSFNASAAGVPTRTDATEEFVVPNGEHHVESGGAIELFLVAASVAAIVAYHAGAVARRRDYR
jgi:hypothetical protein